MGASWLSTGVGGIREASRGARNHVKNRELKINANDNLALAA